LAVSVFYRWRAVAQGGSAVALKRDAQRTPRKDDPEARHKAEMERMRAVIAEITAENLELKKKALHRNLWVCEAADLNAWSFLQVAS
jgi:hypothetical protein